MKKYLYTILAVCGILSFSSCDKWTDPANKMVEVIPQNPESYYANLRNYKNSDHQLAFGWFGGWTAQGATPKSYLMSVPDSVDLVGIWGDQWHRRNMNDRKYTDLRDVRDIKGTKVVVTTLLGWTGKEFPDRPEDSWPADRQEGLKVYAKELAEEVIALGFDGLDLDYEPNVGGQEDVRDCPTGADMVVFVTELGKYLGPKSGTDKLLVIDGELSFVPKEVGDYFDYGISQAYGASAGSNLQNRYDQIKSIFKPEQFIVTENFESYWTSGGVDYRHTIIDEDGNSQTVIIRSMLGMAYWQPVQGVKGGAGSYHMEYEYGHADRNPYKYLRQAIQIMNPAVDK